MGTIEEIVKEQYRSYTYPRYNPNEDKNNKLQSRYYDTSLNQINYYIYGGKKKSFDNFSVLFVGCGMGSEIIDMALKLEKCKNIKLVGVDFSSTQLKMCKKRLEMYAVDDMVELKEMSLLDLKPEIHGTFDMIISSGVLHHLEDPQKGLDILSSLLKEDGFMSLMVYGKYGRTAVYQMQELLKRVNVGIDNWPDKIQNFKNIYKQLPDNNLFTYYDENMIVQDHNKGDEGIVDLLLHNQDRSFSIPELYEWVDNSNLQIIEHGLINRYKYKYNIHNLEYPEKIEDKYAINELFFGDIIKQSFYASKNKVLPPSCDNLECIPILHFIDKKQIASIIENLPYNKDNDKNSDLSKYYTYKFGVNPYIDGLYMKSVNVTINIENLNDNHMELDPNDIWNCIEKMLYSIDNKVSIGEILSIVEKEIERNIQEKLLLNIFKRLYQSFLLYDLILLTY
tara:strand:- start:167 stop:1519 length:1353 start_codon:yes stop_codon:yes gene_type:complete